MITNEELNEKISLFVDYQKQLLKEFSRQPWPLDNFGRIPRNGEFMCLGALWKFRRHGLGVEFVRDIDNLRVDVETQMSAPTYFTAWRLMLFLESQGHENISDKMIDELLSAKEKAGELVRLRRAQDHYAIKVHLDVSERSSSSKCS